MKGTCLKCGCTEERACRGGCAWIDEQEDLCNRCGQELLQGPIDCQDLAEANLVIRAMRSALFETAMRLQALGEAALLVAANQGMDCTGAEIVTPSRELWTPGEP